MVRCTLSNDALCLLSFVECLRLFLSFQRGHDFKLILAHFLMMFYICTKFRDRTVKGFRVMVKV